MDLCMDHGQHPRGQAGMDLCMDHGQHPRGQAGMDLCNGSWPASEGTGWDGSLQWIMASIRGDRLGWISAIDHGQHPKGQAGMDLCNGSWPSGCYIRSS
ncbi:hypothetical protein Bpfe_008755 [Biomphalaria pfeifferi]|uniref:Uncharacterized protein n=1 Tax=Biomphalaria pfeifferi TaxID=112525 RepID=A0AAD8BWG4_BIOPF|nr:hypothetical protein Bpfe_008755 [Biomphalaria pfeifferi]